MCLTHSCVISQHSRSFQIGPRRLRPRERERRGESRDAATCCERSVGLLTLECSRLCVETLDDRYELKGTQCGFRENTSDRCHMGSTVCKKLETRRVEKDTVDTVVGSRRDSDTPSRAGRHSASRCLHPSRCRTSDILQVCVCPSRDTPTRKSTRAGKRDAFPCGIRKTLLEIDSSET